MKTDASEALKILMPKKFTVEEFDAWITQGGADQFGDSTLRHGYNDGEIWESLTYANGVICERHGTTWTITQQEIIPPQP